MWQTISKVSNLYIISGMEHKTCFKTIVFIFFHVQLRSCFKFQHHPSYWLETRSDVNKKQQQSFCHSKQRIKKNHQSFCHYKNASNIFTKSRVLASLLRLVPELQGVPPCAALHVSGQGQVEADYVLLVTSPENWTVRELKNCCYNNIAVFCYKMTVATLVF